MISNNQLSQSSDFLSIVGFTIKIDDKYNIIKGKIEKLIASSEYNFVKLSQILELDNDKMSSEDILTTMMEAGEVIKVADDTFSSSSIINTAKSLLVEYLQKNNKISAAEYRDLLNTNRKSAITLLEYFDNCKITKRSENDRVLNKFN